jgi:citrate synthase
MKRVQFNDKTESGSYEIGSKNQDFLIPRIPEPKETCTLELSDGKTVELPILEGSEGPKSIDGRQFHQKTGLYTFDPGFTSTASCVSSITFIDGDEGKLWYRGYSIDELAAHCSFLEVCFLLLYGDLPSKAQLDIFEGKVKDEMIVHEKVKDFYKGFNLNAHPMSIMCGVVGALSSFYEYDQHEIVGDPK